MQNGDGRTHEIQSKVVAEMAAVSELDGKLEDSYLKQMLRHALNMVGDVESFFLRSARQEPRTPDALSKWLDNAEAALQIAIQQRKLVENVIAKYGPNAQSIG